MDVKQAYIFYEECNKVLMSSHNHKSSDEEAKNPEAGSVAASLEPAPPPSAHFNASTHTNDMISWLLQVGVIVSSIIIIIGLLLVLLQPGALTNQSLTNFPHTLEQFFAGLLRLQPLAVVMLGLAILIATPILRVAFSILAFYLERDYRYVLITCIVLALLILGMLLGKGGA